MLQDGGGALWVDGKAVEEATESELRNSPKRSGLGQGCVSELDDRRNWSNGSTRRQGQGREKHYTLACILGALLSSSQASTFLSTVNSAHPAAYPGIYGPSNVLHFRTVPWIQHHLKRELAVLACELRPVGTNAATCSFYRRWFPPDVNITG